MNKGINISYSNINSPETESAWINMSKLKRILLIEKSINILYPDADITIVNADENGQVSLVINSTLSVDERGTFMLDFEENLKNNIDNLKNIWHEAIGDKSSLRNLRGIEVLS